MKKVIFALLCAAACLASCSKTEQQQKQDEQTINVAMYVAVIEGQNQYVKTSMEYTGNDGKTRTIDVDALSFTSTAPSCLSKNLAVISALEYGYKVKYAKVATETGHSCSLKGVFKYTQAAEPTEPVSYLSAASFEITPNVPLSKKEMSESNASAIKCKPEKFADYLQRHSGKDMASCLVTAK